MMLFAVGVCLNNRIPCLFLSFSPVNKRENGHAAEEDDVATITEAVGELGQGSQGRAGGGEAKNITPH